MHANQQLIQQLYACFSRKDYRGMAACYHPDATFADGVFDTRGKGIAAMWHMLCESAKDLSIQCNHTEANATRGTAEWEAFYTFSRTGRKVHNRLRAQFAFQDGQIIQHRDAFRFWRWASMALGPTGTFLGWTPLVRNGVRKTAAENLKKFVAKHPQYQ
ncbi:MAG: nuclear transport factor 2 family protein [Ferruginibacter sp.]|nr:nuclear transport factor 2 family protein [Cytophagales bacterium]